MVLVVAGAVGLGTLLFQRYAYSVLTAQQGAREQLQRRVASLREEGAGRRREGAAAASNRTMVVLMQSFPYWYELRSGRPLFAACPDSCTLTLDAELVGEVDSVVVYSHDAPPLALLQARGSIPSQFWVYFAVESPFHSNSDVFGSPAWANRFNWTMTYRRDSDFYFGYGDFVKLPSSAEAVRDFSSLVAGKSKMVAWFVSNCKTQSKREDFAAALKAEVEVDVYGHCGDLKCGKEGDASCMAMLSRDYFFYLSFENSLCRDYVTEKLYRTMKLVDIVPVVRGGANYTALLPRNSFIDASHFPSVRALADHLRRVAGDRELYRSYLAWKNEWQVIEPIPFSFCEFCHRLHHPQRWARVYPDVDSWWRKGICHEPAPIVKS